MIRIPAMSSLGKRRGAAHAALALISAPLAAFALSATASAEAPSWIFRRGQFSHDPRSGDRVAQYSRMPPVEPLPDPRLVTSGYRRTRTALPGIGGSTDTYYEVKTFGNGRGGLDAEWERFHDAWLRSFQSAGLYRGSWPGRDRGGFGSGGYGVGFGNGGYGGRFSPGYGGGFLPGRGGGFVPGYGGGLRPSHGGGFVPGGMPHGIAPALGAPAPPKSHGFGDAHGTPKPLVRDY